MPTRVMCIGLGDCVEESVALIGSCSGSSMRSLKLEVVGSCEGSSGLNDEDKVGEGVSNWWELVRIDVKSVARSKSEAAMASSQADRVCL